MAPNSSVPNSSDPPLLRPATTIQSTAAPIGPPIPPSFLQSNSQSQIRTTPIFPVTHPLIYPNPYNPYYYSYGGHTPNTPHSYYPPRPLVPASQLHAPASSSTARGSSANTATSASNPIPPTPSRPPKRAHDGLTSAEAIRTPSSKRARPAPPVQPLPEQPVVYGVGPIISPSRPVSLPSTSASATLPTRVKHREGSKNSSKSPLPAAWFFYRALKERAEPKTLPTDEPILSKHPGTEYAGCKFCPDWRTYSIKKSSTSTLRRHVVEHHLEAYKGILKMLGLNDPQLEPPALAKESFTKQGFIDRLLRWVVVDDQSINVVDCPEFRDLLLYVGDELEDHDIPHRTKLTEDILSTFDTHFKTMTQDLKNSLGRISFTSDLWSDPNLASFMAVTAHYIARNDEGHLCQRSSLVAFKHVVGGHSGNELTKYFVSILKELDVLDRIGMITLDNASNNDTMMEAIMSELTKLGIPFDSVGNRIRCFPHVINLAVQAFLKNLEKNVLVSVIPHVFPDPNKPITTDNPRAPPVSQLQYDAALRGDPLARCRDIISYCRASGQRRAEFQQTIKDGNKNKIFDPVVQELQLLRDCPTRWSSTYMLAKRFLDLQEAIRFFLIRPKQQDSGKTMLDRAELLVLHDIVRILKVPHIAQEALSSERTPTLSRALPAYELVIRGWQELSKQYPLLKHAIDVGLEKIMEYVKKARRTRIYVLAIILNPRFGLAHLEQNWNEADFKAARALLFETMMEFCNTSVPLVPSTATKQGGWSRALTGPASRASNAVEDAFAELQSFSQQSSSSAISLPSNNNAESNSTLTPEEQQALTAQRNRQLVEKEIAGYAAETTSVHHPVAYWEINQPKFPILYRIALDVLPAQASAVPCERVFSSSKDTTTLKRANLSPPLMTALQLLKFSYRNNRLDFTSDWIATEEEFSIDNITPEVIEELMNAGKYDELEDLLATSATTCDGRPPPNV